MVLSLIAFLSHWITVVVIEEKCSRYNFFCQFAPHYKLTYYKKKDIKPINGPRFLKAIFSAPELIKTGFLSLHLEKSEPLPLRSQRNLPSSENWAEREVSSCLESFCLFRKFLPVQEVSARSGSSYLPVDEAILNFLLGKNQMKAHFWLPVCGKFSCLVLKNVGFTW